MRKTQPYLGYYEHQEIKKEVDTIKNNQVVYIEVILFNKRNTIIRNTDNKPVEEWIEAR